MYEGLFYSKITAPVARASKGLYVDGLEGRDEAKRNILRKKYKMGTLGKALLLTTITTIIVC